LALPVAVGAAHVGLAVARDLGEDDVDLRCRRVVGVDQQRDAFVVVGHVADPVDGAFRRDARTIAQRSDTLCGRHRPPSQPGLPRMIEISTANILVALAVTTAAGLATGVGGLLVFTQKAPNARLLAFGLAFAGGAMVYVSLSEILDKSILSFSHAYGERIGFTLGTAAFLAGVGLIMLI